MKNYRNTILTTALFVTVFLNAGSDLHAASPIKPAGYMTAALVYDRSLNSSIGITADYSAVGNTFSITDRNGKMIMTGKIRSGRTFYIDTGKLGNGIYCFQVGGQVLQQFIIK